MKEIGVILGILSIAGGLGFLLIGSSSSEEVHSTKSASEVLTAETESETTEDETNQKRVFKKAIDITTPDGFINTDGEELFLKDLIGKKVVLINFWTYSCINCKRTLGHFNAWYEELGGEDFEIIGIHTPEFAFEHKYENVREAVEKEDIHYPVVLDNDYSTWRSYGNRYWPRRYLIDIDGYIVYDHIGEGAYEETKQRVQEAIAEKRERQM